MFQLSTDGTVGDKLICARPFGCCDKGRLDDDIGSWDRCSDFKNNFTPKISDNIGGFAQTTTNFCNKIDHIISV
jgi:hypothetical protein